MNTSTDPIRSVRLGRVASLACLTAALALFGAGCPREPSPYGGSVTIASSDDPAGLNPLYYLNTAAPNLGSLLFNSLVTVDDRLEYVPELAESWQVLDQGRVWEVRLRPGLRFHDGEVLDSADAAFTFRSVLDPAADSPLAPLYGIVREVRTPDERTVRFELAEPYAPFPNLLILEILPAHLLEGRPGAMEDFGRHPVGSGPFRLERWDEGSITLSANQDYHEGRPYLDRIVARSYPDRARAWAALLAGEVDLVVDLGPDDARVLEGDPRFRLESYLDVFYHTVLFNLNDPLLAEPRLRQALDLAVDRGDLIREALQGAGEPASGPFRPGTWPHDPQVPLPPRDPGRAAALLRELGFRDTDGDLILERDGRELALRLLVDQGDLLKTAVAQRLRWQLLQAGVRLEVELLEPQALFEERLFPGRFQAVLLQFNAGVDPDKFLSFFWHSAQVGASNLGAYASPEADRLIEAGRTATDFEERRRAYRELHAVLARDRPALFLFFRKVYLGASARVQGIQAAPELFYQSARDWRIQPTKERR